ncbi:hypothetical protein KUH03_21970 [Sphingobacterium sp. E70]|uniref:hypothetical protein n=1 Tax=Sphingobacterium sp. E70 TaxID=2853439 RepID=UPI00211B87C4|nr:hypothetical protein [Sphingobacterium sp. E70]ULT22158.1 hypothetical protein KUH03_21970 [Sphingobacterium sp. E70]
MYEKKSEEAELSGIDDGVRIQTVNVVLKEKARKGIFGNAELLGGTKELYAGNLFAAKFNQTERIGITANHNNMGSSNSREGSLRMNNQITGQPLNTSLGANYENQFLKKALKVNANYNYNNSSNKNQSENYNKNILPDNSILERNSKNYNENSARSNGVRSNLSMRLDSTQNIELQTNGNWSNNFSLSQSESATNDGAGAAVSSFNEKNESNTSSQSNNFRLNYRKDSKPAVH